MMIHFVGFRKEGEFTSAVRVWGQPDFVHWVNDNRLWCGGELQPSDTIVFANGCEERFSDWTFNDSNYF